MTPLIHRDYWLIYLVKAVAEIIRKVSVRVYFSRAGFRHSVVLFDIYSDFSVLDSHGSFRSHAKASRSKR